MKTTINNSERLFLLTVNDYKDNKIVCNLKDVESALNWLKKRHPGKRISKRHFWDGQFKIIGTKELNDMIVMNKK
jgi:hypothetical protein